MATFLSPWIKDKGVNVPKLFVDYSLLQGVEIVGQRLPKPNDLVIVTVIGAQTLIDNIAKDGDYFLLDEAITKASLRTYLQDNGLKTDDVSALVEDGYSLTQIINNLKLHFKNVAP
jgi:hypothetical protein